MYDFIKEHRIYLSFEAYYLETKKKNINLSDIFISMSLSILMGNTPTKIKY